VNNDVGVGRCGGKLAQSREEARRGEVPDLVVGDAEVEHDLFEPLAALAGEFDLDRRLLRSKQETVGEVSAPLGTGREPLGERPLALPPAEPELVLDEQADVGDSLDVPDEAVVGLPRAEAGAGDSRPAAREPDERRQLDREASGLRPAGGAPAVAQTAGGSVAATDQDGELVKRERVLLRDEGEQLPVPVGDLVAAPVSPWCSPGWSLLVEDRVGLFLQLDHSLPLLLLAGVLSGVGVCSRSRPRSCWASLPWCVTSLLQTVLSSEVEGGRSRTRSRRRSERQRRPTPHEQTGAGAHTDHRHRTSGRTARTGRLPGRIALLRRGGRGVHARHRIGSVAGAERNRSGPACETSSAAPSYPRQGPFGVVLRHSPAQRRVAP